MTPAEKKRLLTVCTVPKYQFDETGRHDWGFADESGSVLYCAGYKPILINGSKDYAPQLESLVREFLEREYFGELPNYCEIVLNMEELTSTDSALDIVRFCAWKWQRVHLEEENDRAKAWTAGRDILDEIDRINPDYMYKRFYNACGQDYELAQHAVFLYGYEMGLAAARKGAKL